jgi:16S rRNA (cytidine1402-2'-O)-methyltransferase
MLYLIATPIGNLGDLTYRAVEILKTCDLILCEDTRHSAVLLAHYEIRKPLKSYHQFNESEREEQILGELRNGKTIALISDAGTPGICDPGEQLVKRCIEENLPFTALPGPCAIITALTLSGMDTLPFQFIGFLPKKTSEIRKALQEALLYPGTTICYETPHRITETLEILKELAPTRKVAIARELTKKFEECLRGTPEELLPHTFKGEIVLLIEKSTKELDFSELSLEEHVKALEESYGLTRMEAIKMVASLRKLPKKTVYNSLHSDNTT